MNNAQHQKGQSLIEILFAIAVFTVGVVTIGYLVFDSYASLRFGGQSLQARLLAGEGIEASRSMRDADFGLLQEGVHGLIFTDGEWSFGGPSDTTGIFERVITIVDVDDDLKQITSEVSWGSGIQSKSVSLSTYLSNWKQNTGQAKDMRYDIHDAIMTASSSVLSGIALRNTGTSDATVTGLSLQWNTDTPLLRASIGGVTVFTASTSAPASSGEDIDINEYVFGPATGFHLMEFTFANAVEAPEFVLTALFSDDSRKFTRISF